MRSTLLVSLITAGACACSLEEVQSRDGNAEVAIRDVLEAHYRDFSAGNWSAYADHFWADGFITTVWQPPAELADRVVTTTVQEFLARLPRGPVPSGALREQLVDSEIRVSGNLAQAWVRHETQLEDERGVVEWSGVDAFSLLRHRGTWKIASLVFAPPDSIERM